MHSLPDAQLVEDITLPPGLRKYAKFRVRIEYILLMGEEAVKMFREDDRRLRGLAYRAQCDVILSKKIVNRRTNGGVVKFIIIRVTGPSHVAINTFNNLVEKVFPFYVHRKVYHPGSQLTLFSSPFGVDNSPLVLDEHRTGKTANVFENLFVNSPFRSRTKRPAWSTPWKISAREFEGCYDPKPNILSQTSKHTTNVPLIYNDDPRLMTDESRVFNEEDEFNQMWRPTSPIKSLEERMKETSVVYDESGKFSPTGRLSTKFGLDKKFGQMLGGPLAGEEDDSKVVVVNGAHDPLGQNRLQQELEAMYQNRGKSMGGSPGRDELEKDLSGRLSPLSNNTPESYRKSLISQELDTGGSRSVSPSLGSQGMGQSSPAASSGQGRLSADFGAERGSMMGSGGPQAWTSNAEKEIFTRRLAVDFVEVKTEIFKTQSRRKSSAKGQEQAGLDEPRSNHNMNSSSKLLQSPASMRSNSNVANELDEIGVETSTTERPRFLSPINSARAMSSRNSYSTRATPLSMDSRNKISQSRESLFSSLQAESTPTILSFLGSDSSLETSETNFYDGETEETRPYYDSNTTLNGIPQQLEVTSCPHSSYFTEGCVASLNTYEDGYAVSVFSSEDNHADMPLLVQDTSVSSSQSP